MLRRFLQQLKVQVREAHNGLHLLGQLEDVDSRIVLTATGEVAPTKATRFDGVIRKTFVPAEFLEAFEKIVLEEGSTKAPVPTH